MTAGLLLAYALATGFAAPVALRRDWARRVPRTAIAAWLVLAASWLVAIALAAFAVVTRVPLTWQAPGGRADGTPGSPVGTLASAAMTLLAAAVILTASWHLARGLRRTRREQRAHAAFLTAAGRPDHALDIVIIDDDRPAAYCLPLARHPVVFSSGALSRLRPGQLRAVLAHERAHLRGRHHLILACAAALARAFPDVPLFARAPTELAVLAEMAADDTAARRHDAADLAAALVTLAASGARAATLTAGGPAAIVRIQRLLAPAPPPGLPARTAKLAACAAALVIPAAVITLPLAIAACDIIAGT